MLTTLNGAFRLAIFLGTWGWAVPALAEPVEGRVQVGFDAEVLGHRPLTATTGTSGDVSASDTTLGLGGGSFGFGLDVRPFGGPLLGYETTSSDVQNVESTTSSVVLGIQGGIHAFVTSSFSVDPSVTLAYATGSTEAGDVSADLSGFVLGFRLGLNGWLGQGSASEGASAEPSRAAVPPENQNEGVPRTSPVTNIAGSGRRQSVGLSNSARIMFEVEDGGDVHFEFIDLGASPGDTCDGVSLSYGSTRESLEVENASVVPWGSSQALVASGSVRTAMLAEATKPGAILSACGEDFELDVLARRQIARIVKTARR